MATKVMSLRLPDDLREWVVAYAGERGVSQAVVISAAVREFREAAKVGVPVLEEPSATARLERSAPAAPRAPVLEQASDDNRVASPAGASERPSHTGDHASAAGAVPARVAPRPTSARVPVRKAVIAPFGPVGPQTVAAQERVAALEARQAKLNAAKERNG